MFKYTRGATRNSRDNCKNCSQSETKRSRSTSALSASLLTAASTSSRRELVLAAVRSEADKALVDRLRLVSDWEQFLQLSRELRVAPRVYLNISRLEMLGYPSSDYHSALKAN